MTPVSSEVFLLREQLKEAPDSVSELQRDKSSLEQKAAKLVIA